jgi:hypothetical protein
MSHHLPTQPGPVRSGPVRIGDAERDQAVTALSEHFVAGRLTQDEFEERSDQATRSRYADDLSRLFEDLPDSTAVQVGPRAWSPGVRPDSQALRQGPRVLVLLPLLLVGLVVAAIALDAPWLLWGFFWIAMWAKFFSYSRRRLHRR